MSHVGGHLTAFISEGSSIEDVRKNVTKIYLPPPYPLLSTFWLTPFLPFADVHKVNVAYARYTNCMYCNVTNER